MPDDIAAMPQATADLAASINQPMAEKAAAGVQELNARGTAASEHFQELTQFYQSMLARNMERMTSAIGRLSSVKSPADFMEVQQALLKEAVEATIADSQHLAKLNTAILTAAFQPMQVLKV